MALTGHGQEGDRRRALEAGHPRWPAVRWSRNEPQRNGCP